MSTSFCQLLQETLPHLGSTIASHPQRLSSFAAQLPPSPYGLLEVRLAPGNNRIDISQGFWPAQFSRLEIELRESGQNSTADLLRGLLTASTPYPGLLNGIGLEYDDRESIPTAQAPSLFLAVNKSPGDSLTAFETVFAETLAQVHGKNAAHELLAALANTRRALPKHARLKDVGLMLSRDGQALRLQLQDILPSEMIPLLKCLGLPKPPAALAHATAVASRLALGTIVCVDFSPALIPRIGIELCFREGEMDIPGALDILVEEKLCCPAKAADLQAWPGKSYPQKALLDLMDYLEQSSVKHNERRLTVIQRSIAHLKLLVSDDETVTAKAYLEFRVECLKLSAQ